MHKNTRYTVGRLIITFDDTKYQGYCVLLQNLKNIYPQNCKIVHKFLLLHPQQYFHKIFCLKHVLKILKILYPQK